MIIKTRLPFHVKRARAAKGQRNLSPGSVPIVLYADGYVDDTGEAKATIVLNATLSSNPTAARKSVQRLCDDLNAAWLQYYEGAKAGSLTSVQE
jgi:hypothetical protein